MSLSLRCPSALSLRSAARPAARQAVRPAARSIVVMRAEATKASPVESAIKEAEDACKDGATKECAAAWDVVEEVSSATADKKAFTKANSDPLEQFCEGDPSADECRVYED